MKVIVTGKGGQLATELERCKPESVELISLDRDQLDISDADAVSALIKREQPQAVINAAAYTNVDGAESDRHGAWQVNATGPANLARACVEQGAYLLHVSTDFVFDGTSSRPYLPDAATGPLSVYGESKLAGEQAIASAMASNWGIIRTAWVFSSVGGNFVKTILRLAAERPQLNIISDQIGSPTSAAALAQICWLATERQLQGIHHYSCDGVASWFDFAVAICELGQQVGLLDKAATLAPIPTEAYPTPATRPGYSVLDTRSLHSALEVAPRIYWRRALLQVLEEIRSAQ